MSEENTGDGPGSVAGYDRLAREADRLERWESPWADSHYQAHYVWPAVRPLLPDLGGLSVLDAGCGLGHYGKRFLDGGASVVGIDASEEALAAARSRCGGATFVRQDLTEPFGFASAGAFDLVFCNLVLDHIEDWRPVLSEFARVLTPGGVLVLTTIHPFRRYLNHRDELESYHETEGYAVEWGSTDACIESYYRPLEEVIEPLVAAGFAVTAFREPRPQSEYEAHEPERYEAATNRPDTLCIRARTDEDG